MRRGGRGPTAPMPSNFASERPSGVGLARRSTRALGIPTAMTSDAIKERLLGIQQMLLGARAASGSLSTATKGREREAFINGFLAEVLPPHFRFGSGDAIDQAGRRSGQLDIVVEYPFLPSLPLVAGRSPRLYLAEGIVAVIEVKSDVASQWPEVEQTARTLSTLQRDFQYERGVSIGPRAMPRIPLFVVGYGGWKNFETVRQHVDLAKGINGVLVIEYGHFFGKYPYVNEKDEPQAPFTRQAAGSPIALWELITCVHYAASMVTSATKNVPKKYGIQDA